MGGIALVSIGDDPYSQIGGNLMLPSLPALTIGSIFKSRAIKRNFHRAFWEYNGMSWGSGH